MKSLILPLLSTAAGIAMFFSVSAAAQTSSPSDLRSKTLSQSGVVLHAPLPSGLKYKSETYNLFGFQATLHKWVGRRRGCCKTVAFIASVSAIGNGKSVVSSLPESLRQKILSYVQNRRLKSLGATLVKKNRFQQNGRPAIAAAFRAKPDPGGSSSRQTRAIMTRVILLGSKVAGVEVHMPLKDLPHDYPSSLFDSFSVEAL